jgi:gliding motility-associated-like protein
VNVASPGGICPPATTSVTISTMLCPTLPSVVNSQNTAGTYDQMIIQNMRLAIPNLVTANGDGKNDTWMIENISEFENCKVTILDLNGKIVHESQPYKNDWTTNVPGNYLYSIQLNTEENPDPIQGILTVFTN